MEQGDRKTPLGSYPLGKPRLSEQFGIFISIGYPTLEQRRNEKNPGGAVGIHGPPHPIKVVAAQAPRIDSPYFQGFNGKIAAFAGFVAPYLPWGKFDWTDGCIAMDRNAVSQLAQRLAAKNIGLIHVLESAPNGR